MPSKNTKEKVGVREKQIISMIGPCGTFLLWGRMRGNSQKLGQIRGSEISHRASLRDCNVA